MLKRILQTVVLPKEITQFEHRYLRRINRIGVYFYLLHLPVFVAIAFFNDTGPLLAAGLTLFVLLGPIAAYFAFESVRAISIVHGVTAMLMGGLLVHFGQGPVQIEMHFYFFALLAMLALFGNPMVILTAALTVTLHHLLLWIFLPSSVFNYDAPLWVVAVHAAFVVLESVGTCFIARSFFDNVIGLEKIVLTRTEALHARNRDMRLLLDNVNQGFLTIQKDGTMSPECSAAVTRWFGPRNEGETFVDYIKRSDEQFAEGFEMQWEQGLEDILPMDICLAMAPKELRLGGSYFEVQYRVLGETEEAWSEVLVMVSDVTARVERERLEAEQREVFQLFDRIVKDKAGFLEFYEEAQEQVALIADDCVEDLVTLKRVIHTLKGNSAVFGLQGISQQCHVIEEGMQETQGRPTEQQRDLLRQTWDRIRKSLSTMIGDRDHYRIEIEDKEYEAVLLALVQDEPRERIVQTVVNWKLEPTERRLERLKCQATRIADRLNKGALEVETVDNALRLESGRWTTFWASIIHVLRNAIDHGIEPASERVALGKSENGRISIETRIEGEQFIVRLSDDGRGIDWKAIAAKAESLGLPASERSELEEAMFYDGLSTKMHVSEMSGRGVGLAAVRTACERMNGTIRISSRPGRGATFEFLFPKDMMASAPSFEEHFAA